MVEAIENLRTQAQRTLGRETAEVEWEMGRSIGIDGAISIALQRRLSKRPQSRFSVLSARELEVAGLVAEGLADRDIAERIHVSRRTVDNHVFHILNKLVP